MKFERVVISHDIEEELLEHEISLINQAICARRSHLRSVDELDRRDIAPKKRKGCSTPKKRKYKSKQEADAALHSMENRRAEAEAMGIQFRFKAFRAYACGNHWHCSSKPAHASLESFHAA